MGQEAHAEEAAELADYRRPHVPWMENRGSREDTRVTFEKWGNRMAKNKFARSRGNPPENNSFIHPFEDPRDAPLVRLA
jgi:hypothetical protein